MSLKAVTFDAAGTLIRVDWRPGAFAVKVLERLGLTHDPQVAQERYERFVLARRAEYERLNFEGGQEACEPFWRELTADWLSQLGLETHSEAVVALADALLYDPAEGHFTLFDDVLPILDFCAGAGLKLAVISNWDYTLHRVLKVLGIEDRFGLVLASLEHGVEKPDKRLFDIALHRLGITPQEAIHIGDHVIDDVQGALGAGMRAVHLDRLGEPSAERVPRIQSLSELPGVLSSID